MIINCIYQSARARAANGRRRCSTPSASPCVSVPAQPCACRHWAACHHPNNRRDASVKHLHNRGLKRCLSRCAGPACPSSPSRVGSCECTCEARPTRPLQLHRAGSWRLVGTDLPDALTAMPDRQLALCERSLAGGHVTHERGTTATPSSSHPSPRHCGAVECMASGRRVAYGALRRANMPAWLHMHACGCATGGAPGSLHRAHALIMVLGECAPDEWRPVRRTCPQACYRTHVLLVIFRPVEH